MEPKERKLRGEMKNVKKRRSFLYNPNNYLRDSSKTSSFLLKKRNSKAVQAKKSVR